MDKVVQLKSNRAVVELLEELLNEAKAGEIQGIAVAGLYVDGCSFNTWASHGREMLLLAELSILVRDFTDCQIDLRCDPKAQ